MTQAKAYAALVGAVCTALLGVFAADTTVGQVLTVLAVIATTVATYQIPNRPAGGARKRPADVGPEAGVMDLERALVVVLLVAAILGVVAFIVNGAG